ncbi:MAG TPA: hypothetical protein VGO59_00450 [Verrucomicrobiae bacterium]
MPAFGGGAAGADGASWAAGWATLNLGAAADAPGAAGTTNTAWQDGQLI